MTKIQGREYDLYKIYDDNTKLFSSLNEFITLISILKSEIYKQELPVP